VADAAQSGLIPVQRRYKLARPETSAVRCAAGAKEKTMEWSESRIDELERLERLLRDVANLNDANNVLERMARCIVEAKALLHSDLRAPRRSFTKFLADRALGYSMSEEAAAEAAQETPR
jgi:hypothetical protein